jgi:quercetin dioxygenase-like cupin family protein
MNLIKYTQQQHPEIIKGEGLYTHTIYTGTQEVEVEEGDTAWFLAEENVVSVAPGPTIVVSKIMCVVIRGYTRSELMVGVNGSDTNLPYINGCSTDQLIHPIRPGDPTFQKLTIPPHASEQKHHIHSTPRVVYVLEGTGKSIVGMKGQEEYVLEKGDIIILNKMEPHHFETEDSHLTVLPLHVYSSTPLEHNHAMKIGTHEV